MAVAPGEQQSRTGGAHWSSWPTPSTDCGRGSVVMIDPGDAAVDEEGLAGDVAGLVGGQPQDGRGHVVGPAQASERDTGLARAPE